MSAPVAVLAVDTARLREISRSSGDTAKTNALRNAANEIDRLRTSLDELTAAAKKLHIVTAGLSQNVDANERSALLTALARVKGGAA